MIGRQLVQALAGRREPGPPHIVRFPDGMPGEPQPQVHAILPSVRGLRRPCGCDCDVAVFGHVCCPDAPPWAHRLEW